MDINIYIYIYIYIYVYIHTYRRDLYTHIYFYILYIYISISLSFYLSIYLSFYLSIFIYIYIYIVCTYKVKIIKKKNANAFGKRFICIYFPIWFQIIQIYHTVDKYWSPLQSITGKLYFFNFSKFPKKNHKYQMNRNIGPWCMEPQDQERWY